MRRGVWLGRGDRAINFLPRDARVEWVGFPTVAGTAVHGYAKIDSIFRREVVLEKLPRTAHPAICAARRLKGEGQMGVRVGRRPSAAVADEVCHWRDMTFGPHLLNLLFKREVQVNSEGAQFFVRGDGRRMAKDVDAALHKQERGTGERLRGKRQDRRMLQVTFTLIGVSIGGSSMIPQALVALLAASFTLSGRSCSGPAA
jgi:hypothetical protein